MHRLTQLRLQTRISLLIIIILLLIFSFMSWKGRQFIAMAIQGILQERLTSANTAAILISRELEHMLIHLEKIAASPAINLEDGDLEPEKAELKHLHLPEVFTYVFLLDKDGLVLWTEPYLPEAIGVKHLESPHVLEALRTGRPGIAYVTHALIPERPAVVPVAPIRNQEGTIVGALGAAIDPASAFSDLLRQAAPGRTGYAQLVDENGIVLAHSHGRRLFQKSEHAELFISLLQKGEASVATHTVTEENKGTYREVTAFAPLTMAPWGVAVEQAEEELQTPVLEMRHQLNLFAVIATATAIFWVLALIRYTVVRPLHQLIAASRRITAGDLITPVPPLGRDEIGELGLAFEEMRQRLARWGECLEAAVQQHTRHLSVLYAIDRAAAQSLELEEVLNSALDKALEVLDMDAGAILLLEADGQTLTIQVHRGYSPQFIAAVQRVASEDTAAGRAIGEGRPVVMDISQHPSAWLASLLAKEGIQTIVSTPLLSGGKVLGAISLNSRRPRTFPPEEMDLLAAMGGQLGQAVHNALLFQETRQRAERLAFLNSIARALSTAPNLNELLETIYREVTTCLKADAFFIALYDPTANELDYRILVDKGVREPPQRRPLRTGLTASIITGRHPILVRDFEKEKEHLPPVRLWGTMQAPQSWLGVPMMLGDDVIGAIAVQAYQPNAYGKAEQELLSTIADAVAVAIKNVQLREAQQRYAARLAALHHLSTELAAMREEDVILNTLVARTQAIAESPTCTVMLVDEATNEAVLAAQVGLPEGTPLGLRVPLTLPIIRRSLETGEPIIAPNIDRDAPELRQLLVRKDLQAFFAYPMVWEGRVLGYITLSSLTPCSPSAEETTAYRLLAERAAAIESARLQAQVLQGLQRITRLYELSSEILTTTTVEDTATLVAQKVVQVTGAHSALISLLDPDGRITLRIGAAASGTLPPEPPPRPAGATMAAIHSGEPVIVTGLDERSDLFNPRLVEMGIKAFISLPLKVYRRVTGVLLVRYTEPHLFSADEVQALTIYANQAAIALERARLFAENRQRLAELETIFAVSSALRGATTVGEMLPIILDKVLEVSGGAAGAIFLVERAAGQIVVSAALGAMTVKVGRRCSLDGTIAERLLQTGEPYVSLNLAADPRLPEEMRALFRGGESGIGLPLLAAGTPIGLLALAWPEPHAVTASEMRLLTAIADIVANAIHRVGLFEELQTRVRELTTIYEVSKAITATLRIQDMLDFVVSAACQTLHAEGAYLFLWDERAERLVLRAVKGYPPRLVGEVEYRLGEGLAGWVFLEGKLANVPNLDADPRCKREPEEAALPSGRANNALVVPLIVGTKIIGVLGMVNKIGVPAFTASDQSLLVALAGQVAIAIENARLYEDVRGLSLATIRSLATAIDARDPYTRGHSERVARLSVRLARELGWSGADLEMLEFAALLHDVGKIGIPDAVLAKKEPLTPVDWNHLHLHPYYSAQIVKPVESLQHIIPWIYHHQERWDGTGYPDGLKGERIPLGARIIAIADAFEAMTSDRPYRRAMSQEEAIAELRRCAGNQFDPQLVETFLGLLKRGIE